MCVRILVVLPLVLLMFGVMGCQTTLIEEQPKPSTQRPPAEEQRSAAKATSYYYYSSAQLELKSGRIDRAAEFLEKAIAIDPDSSYLKMELAELRVFSQKFDQAMDLLEQILKNDPDNLQALTMAGRIYQHLDKLPKAKQAYEKAMTIRSVDQSVFLSLGRIYWDEQDMGNAARVFQLMAKHHPDSYAAHYFVGKALAAQGKYKQAEEAFDRSLELDPSLAEPRLELIEIFKTQKRTQDVIQSYRALLELDPQNHSAALGLAVYYHDIGQLKTGRAMLIDLGRRSREEPDLLGVIFDVYLENRQYKTALWILTGLLEGDSQNSDLHYLTGVAYDGLNKSREALRHLTQVTPESRFYGNAVVHSALLLRDAEQMTLAIEKVRQGLRHDPTNADFYFYLGVFNEELERYEEALALLRKGLALDDKNARLHFRLGVVLDKVGKRFESIESMKTVVRLTPDDADALNYLGYTYADMGIELEEARRLIESALKLKPDDGYFIDSLGWVFFKRGDYDSALKWLLKASSLVKDDPVIYEHLGDVYEKLGQKQKARHYYNRSLEVNAKNREVIKLKIKLLGGTQSSPP